MLIAMTPPLNIRRRWPLIAGSVGALALAGRASRSRPVVESSRPDPCGPDGWSLPDGTRRTVLTDDGAQLAVCVAGPADGPTVVMAHCYTGDMTFWAPAARELVAHGLRVVLYDHRGHGESSLGTGPVTVGRLGADLAAVIADLDLRDLVVVGHSMGGMAVQAFATELPGLFADRVRSVALVATSARVAPVRLPPVVARVVTRDPRRTELDRRAARKRRKAFGAHVHRSHLEAVHRSWLATDATARAECLVAMTEMDYRLTASSLDVPAIVMVGADDKVTPEPMARRLADGIPDAELRVLPHLGHMLPLEAPSIVATAIRRLAMPVKVSA